MDVPVLFSDKFPADQGVRVECASDSVHRRVLDIFVATQRQVPTVFFTVVVKTGGSAVAEHRKVVDIPVVTQSDPHGPGTYQKTIEIPQLQFFDKVVYVPGVLVVQVSPVHVVEETVVFPQLQLVEKIVVIPEFLTVCSLGPLRVWASADQVLDKMVDVPVVVGRQVREHQHQHPSSLPSPHTHTHPTPPHPTHVPHPAPLSSSPPPPPPPPTHPTQPPTPPSSPLRTHTTPHHTTTSVAFLVQDFSILLRQFRGAWACVIATSLETHIPSQGVRQRLCSDPEW